MPGPRVLLDEMRSMSVSTSTSSMVALGFGLALALFYLIKHRLGCVQCWFCHQHTKVSYSERNSWRCPRSECGQYNGFKEDGDYNKVDKNMFREIKEGKKRNKKVRKTNWVNVVEIIAFHKLLSGWHYTKKPWQFTGKKIVKSSLQNATTYNVSDSNLVSFFSGSS